MSFLSDVLSDVLKDTSARTLQQKALDASFNKGAGLAIQALAKKAPNAAPIVGQLLSANSFLIVSLLDSLLNRAQDKLKQKVK